MSDTSYTSHSGNLTLLNSILPTYIACQVIPPSIIMQTGLISLLENMGRNNFHCIIYKIWEETISLALKE